jgi:hypothetical protein
MDTKWDYLYAVADLGSSCVIVEDGKTGIANPELPTYLAVKGNAGWELVSSSSPSSNSLVMFFKKPHHDNP